MSADQQQAMLEGAPSWEPRDRTAEMQATLERHVVRPLIDKVRDIYYLQNIKRRLDELKRFVSEMDEHVKLPTLGSEALNDEIDWLDCYIDRVTRGAE